EPADKVTETFTGKERDDETELNYFGARYLDPMLGLWTSVDPKRQFASPYLYAGNGVNPVNGVDDDGKAFNPFGLLVGVGTGVAASWDAQAEYRRVSGENYNPVTETIVGVVTYGAYVAAGAVGINGGLLKATLLGGLVGGLTSGGSTAFAEILGSEKLEGFDGDKVAEDFTKGFVTTAFGAMMGAGATELLGGAAPAGYVAPSSAEAIGGAVGGAAGFVLDQCTTSEWNKEFAE
ncbi:RHS repeat-associated core domain-containing protein, partial [Fibrobacter sp. UWH1]